MEMVSSSELLHVLIEEANSAKAHFQIWWALRNRALPDFLPAMNNGEVRLFFHASNSGNFKLIFITLGIIFDTDTRASSLRSLKVALRSEGRNSVADKLEDRLRAVTPLAQKIINLRGWAFAHIQQDLRGDKAFQLNGGITPDQVRDIIDEVGDALNEAAEATRLPMRVTIGTEFETATLALLGQLRAGQA